MMNKKLFVLPLMMLFKVLLVAGTTANYDVAVANDDWYVSTPGGRFDGSTLLRAEQNNIASVTSETYGDIDTSPIPDGDTIDSATLYFYIDSYTSSKGVAKTFSTFIDDGTLHLIDTSTFTAAGWKSIVLTPAELGYLDKTGLTHIKITVPDPGVSKSRVMLIRAREYATADAWDMYLTVTHTTPVSDSLNITLINPINDTNLDYEQCIYYAPSSAELIKGAVEEGDYTSMSDVDGITYNVSETVGTPGSRILINFSGVDKFNRLIAYDDYAGNEGHNIDFVMYNFSTNYFDILFQETDENMFGYHNVKFNSSVNYVSDGTVRTEYNHTSPGNINHQLIIDYLSLEYCPVSFDYNISASDSVDNCTLIVDDVPVRTEYDIVNGTTNSIYWGTGDVSEHNWTVNCSLTGVGNYGDGLFYYNTDAIKEFIELIKDKQVYPILMLVMMLFIVTQQQRKEDEEKEM